jgi:hypothetical protein
MVEEATMSFNGLLMMMVKHIVKEFGLSVKSAWALGMLRMIKLLSFIYIT